MIRSATHAKGVYPSTLSGEAFKKRFQLYSNHKDNYKPLMINYFSHCLC